MLFVSSPPLLCVYACVCVVGRCVAFDLLGFPTDVLNNPPGNDDEELNCVRKTKIVSFQIRNQIIIFFDPIHEIKRQLSICCCCCSLLLLFPKYLCACDSLRVSVKLSVCVYFPRPQLSTP